MFSIAAINESDTGGQWEPLAPTKEAQESALSQKYHEGLLKLQEKDYTKARDLLEDVLKDPLISKIQVDNIGSDQHLLQLRFLTLKNLASVFLQQGSDFYDNALHCYLQAVELDANDSVVWNHLGTLSCSMGLLSTSRWAFEQGLQCSPNNWNCMEKLLEVLIAICDEVACLSVANLILRSWPSHHRALHVKKTIEDAEPVPFAPRGIDILEPKHAKLNFSKKRKSADDEMHQETRTKRSKQNVTMQLVKAKWVCLLDGLFSFLTANNMNVEDHDANTKTRCFNTEVRIKGLAYCMMDVVLSTDTSKDVESTGGNRNDVYHGGESVPSHDCKTTTKERDVNSDREHPHERRSTRLERLRSRKSGKDENESNGKDISHAITQFLDSFILKLSITTNKTDCSGNPNTSNPETFTYTSDHEANDVKQFLSNISKNYGPHHIGYMLLEEIAHLNIPFQDYFVKFTELDKLTRGWAHDRSAVCSLFLAELYYDQALCSESPSTSSELSDSSYHLCKVIESIALELPFTTSVKEMNSTSFDLDMENHGVEGSGVRTERDASDMSKSSENTDKSVSKNMLYVKTSEPDSSSNADRSLWIRFFWLSGCLSLSSNCKKKAFKEFNIALSLLRSCNEGKNSSESVLLPRSKLVKYLTADRILREINLIKLDSLLWNNDENINKITHTEFKELLPPLLLSTKDVYVGNAYGSPSESEKIISLELSALDVLISACENSKPMNVQIYLDCHRRKMQVLTVVAGMVGYVTPHKGKISSDVDFVEAMNRNRLESVVEAVKDISRNTSKAKDFLDECDPSGNQDGLSSLVPVIGEIQSLLLTIMCASVKMISSRKHSCSGVSYQADQLESSCLIDAAIAFCKLQHLDPTISIKTQVDLIVAVHDLLAEYGLCCAGRDGEGEEGTFLKFAIKHLMALDVKLKSQLNPNGMEEDSVPENDRAEDTMTDTPSVCDNKHNSEDEEESELEEIQSSIDSALDQAFFCLYGLKINPDSCSEDDLAVHKNTSRGDYQTKEQCADVFQYVLPYAKALSKTGLVKLRRVLRAIRKLFPQPPSDLLVNSPLDNFLDGPDSCERILCEIYENNGSREAILNVLFPGEKGYEVFKNMSTASSEPYSDVYANLYYYIAQAEDISATDKYTGFVLKKEGEEFVEQSANLFKYDLLYNPLRFESWRKLANLYDEEVDLLLNDGSKHISILDWRTNTTLIQRVETGRRHSRRCLLMSLTLAQTVPLQTEIHELLALVYYDSLQNVVPFYDQRAALPVKDLAWETFCRNSMKHFEKAFELKAEWLYAFYLGKLCEKLRHSPAKAFSYYNKAIALNPPAVDPVYRMHASRMKLLYTQGKKNHEAIQVVADYTYNQSTKENVLRMLGSIANVQHSSSNQNDIAPDSTKENKVHESDLLDKVWHILYDDCLYALSTCVEGELKHFHKARYKLAQGFYRRGETGDLERAKEELSFCFKSTRSSFTVNMWEIDGTVRKGRRKNPNIGGSRKNLEVSLSESSRKFITCIRKYMILYLNLLEKNRDLWTLERAYTYLRTDKRFALCLGDIVPVGLGKYLQVLTAAIRNPEIRRVSCDTSVEQLLEKMFGVFMDHANLWADISTIPEVNSPELSESNLYSYIHQYIHLLESDVRLDILEALNEKIRKRFKTPKLSNSNFAKICKHASLAWCRCILIKLATITPLPESVDTTDQPVPLSNGLLLYVDLQPDELLISSPDGPAQFKGLDMNWFETLNRIKNIPIRQTSEDNMEAAVTVMKSTYNLYRESSCGTFPSGINLYTVTPAQAPIEGLSAPGMVDNLDLSIPRKLLLWVYTLVHGRYSNISSVVKYCDEMKTRNKRGTQTATTSSQVLQPPSHSTTPSQVGSKEKSTHVESGEAHEANPLAPTMASAAPHQEVGGASALQIGADALKPTIAASQLTRSSSSRAMENPQGGTGGRVNDGTA